ncbi:hypothetical protein ERJ75_000292100 [Trypanosoma vivax]|nr:hypothetical protein ERJ75_000292100 [Trypanosoma vivax]
MALRATPRHPPGRRALSPRKRPANRRTGRSVLTCIKAASGRAARLTASPPLAARRGLPCDSRGAHGCLSHCVLCLLPPRHVIGPFLCLSSVPRLLLCRSTQQILAHLVGSRRTRRWNLPTSRSYRGLHGGRGSPPTDGVFTASFSRRVGVAAKGEAVTSSRQTATSPASGVLTHQAARWLPVFPGHLCHARKHRGPLTRPGRRAPSVRWGTWLITAPLWRPRSLSPTRARPALARPAAHHCCAALVCPRPCGQRAAHGRRVRQAHQPRRRGREGREIDIGATSSLFRALIRCLLVGRHSEQRPWAAWRERDLLVSVAAALERPRGGPAWSCAMPHAPASAQPTRGGGAREGQGDERGQRRAVRDTRGGEVTGQAPRRRAAWHDRLQ